MKAIRYTIKNIRARKNSAKYIISILIYSKNASLATIKVSQVLLVYEYINKELWRDLSKSFKASIIVVFISDLRL